MSKMTLPSYPDDSHLHCNSNSNSNSSSKVDFVDVQPYIEFVATTFAAKLSCLLCIREAFKKN